MIKAALQRSVTDGIRAIEKLQEPQSLKFIEGVAGALADCFRRGNKVLIAGNGGSLCDACHFAEELTGFFRRPRAALPAIALSEPGHITCTGNDLGFEWIFSRGVEAYGKAGDIFVGLTTSGNSANIVRAVEAAQARNMTVVTFLGKGGGQLRGVGDWELLIDGFGTSDRIQEAHMAAIHMVIELMEYLLFPELAPANKQALASSAF